MTLVGKKPMPENNQYNDIDFDYNFSDETIIGIYISGTYSYYDSQGGGCPNPAVIVRGGPLRCPISSSNPTRSAIAYWVTNLQSISIDCV